MIGPPGRRAREPMPRQQDGYGRSAPPRREFTFESLDRLDRYLGPVKR